MTQLFVRSLAMAALLALGGCGGASPNAGGDPPLAGAAIGGPFTLVDQDGHTVTRDSFAGKYRVMYFGYTYCPDVCPVDMQHLAAAMRDLDKRDPSVARKIVPIFVSVDPARDTPPVLDEFVSAFYPRLVGLTGSDTAIAAIAKEYGVFYAKEKPVADADGYLVQHTSAAYLMGPDDRPIALVPVDQSADAVAAMLRKWVQ